MRFDPTKFVTQLISGQRTITLAPGASDGADGAPGVPGEPGRDGRNGYDGAPGPAGATGATGSTGATGATGSAGAAGSTGARGLEGVPGWDGRHGRSGFDGVPGERGATGATGAAGSNGSAGATGARGLEGVPGWEGKRGRAGYDGAPGDSGLVVPQRFHYYRSASVTLTKNVNNIIVFDTKIFDNTGAFNAGTGVFTPARTGYYQINAVIHGTFGAGTYALGDFFILSFATSAGAEIRRYQQYQVTAIPGAVDINLQLTGASLEFLTAGSGYALVAIPLSGQNQTLLASGFAQVNSFSAFLQSV